MGFVEKFAIDEGPDGVYWLMNNSLNFLMRVNKEQKI